MAGRDSKPNAHQKEILIPTPVQSLGTSMSLYACLLTFSHVPINLAFQLPLIACRMPKTSVSLACPSNFRVKILRSGEIARKQALSPTSPRCVQCWGLAYGVWSDVAHSISTCTV